MSQPIVAIPSLIPCPHYVGRAIFTATSVDINGDAKGTWADPIPMPAQGFYQTGTQQPISQEYAFRQVQELVVMVPDASPYDKRDHIFVGGQATFTGTVATGYSGGRAFAMDGDPADYTQGSPFVDMIGVFGAQLFLKRVG